MVLPLTLGFGSEVRLAISFGVGATALAILFGLMLALTIFGAGREHS